MTDSCVFLEKYLWHFKKTLGIKKARYTDKMNINTPKFMTFNADYFLC